ncbi:MAG: hypothetical protein KF819_06200 [Labilithrix sp.]|nr:hypothetical protein [Labilithrix sp.]
MRQPHLERPLALAVRRLGRLFRRMTENHLEAPTALALRHLGRRYQDSGDPERAADAFARALAILRKTDDRAATLAVLVELALVVRTSDEQRALTLLLEARETAAEIGDSGWLAKAVADIAAIYVVDPGLSHPNQTVP